jgi:hypothetical protein
MAAPGRVGDNDGMACDDGKAGSQRLAFLMVLDGARPSGALGWVSPLAPVVTQAAVGAGHWASGRRRRALAAWASAAGSALRAWGLATEAPTRAEVDENIRRHTDLLRKPGQEAPATAAAETPMPWLDALASSVQMVLGVRSGLRRPRRLTVRAIADETFGTVVYALRAARAVQQRRPRIAAGSALAAAGAVARLWAAKAEPLPVTKTVKWPPRRTS